MLELLLLVGAAIGAVAGATSVKRKKRARPLVQKISVLLLNDGWTTWNSENDGPVLYNPELGIIIYFEERTDENNEFMPVSFRVLNMPARQILKKSERSLLHEAMFQQSERFLLNKQVMQLETSLG